MLAFEMAVSAVLFLFNGQVIVCCCTQYIFFIHAMSMSCIIPLRLQIFDEQKPGFLPLLARPDVIKR